jgi:hypothetical protein
VSPPSHCKTAPWHAVALRTGYATTAKTIASYGDETTGLEHRPSRQQPLLDGPARRLLVDERPTGRDDEITGERAERLPGEGGCGDGQAVLDTSGGP